MKKYLVTEETLNKLVLKGAQALAEAMNQGGVKTVSLDQIYDYLDGNLGNEDLEDEIFRSIPDGYQFKFRLEPNGDAYCVDQDIIDTVSQFGPDAMDYINFAITKWYEDNGEDYESAINQRAQDDAADERGEMDRHPDLY